MDTKRERLSSRLGFLLVSAGCAIGLGNIWRFPYITGKYGGAAFVIIYIISLLVVGIPILIMEFSIGRAGQRDIAGSYKVLEKKGHKWHIIGYVQIIGCLILMMFYTTVAGWSIIYSFYMLIGKIDNLSAEGVGELFGATIANPYISVAGLFVTVLLATIICFIGLQKGVEKYSKFMMSSLFVIVVILIIRSITLPNAIEGVKFYLLPDLGKMFNGGIENFFEVVYAAVGQAFFTLGIGIGSMTIFGSYIGKERTITNETLIIVVLDTLIAFLSGLVIFPASFAFGVNPGEGPGLAFVTLPNIFNSMPLSRVWGLLFFVFLSMAALTTVITVFENLIAFTMSEFNLKRNISSVIVGIVVFVLGSTTALGFNVLSFIEPMGKGTSFLDLYDFIVTYNLVELGGVYIIIFCVSKYGWGWNNFIKEADMGMGIKFPQFTRVYITYILPVIIFIIFIINYIVKFS
ncbi:sodium-dependent transporter [Brachyspira pilosicoli]|uniref:Transporter n=3 Tax=Brachyspira pilosicoli TaxID=52584 RepID=D8IAA6_BRAP9|nr:sodium-dependent transporter [Brachyspira pilosicoli]ADK32236.1 sodium/chloride-dependent transporter [Brachyspira pilosicoli 95/1000]AGA66002.1 sodium/chloride-dependent transporter [Brachyspira pilosicoli P43/6/78]MBW5379009.1 sodium-dependent transporter [Brachyspira pilosicoli]MBW5381966.1 sodium-dependent transporter [Brachyspira pilosicoli]MBW5392876.1 sodium-dependent transporter [Brachyspira pilosicoli]